MRISSRLALLALAAIIASCSSPSGGTTSKPVETKFWPEVNGNYQFYTNDKAYYNYAFWLSWEDKNASAVFTNFTGIAKRVSGPATQGYGFQFCYRYDKTNSKYSYYRILINTNGRFRVSKFVDPTWTTIQDWTSSSHLVQGLNQENTVRVTRTSAGVFTVNFNGSDALTFTDTELSANGVGAVATVGIASVESFPDTPADFRFRFTSTLPSNVQGPLMSIQ